MTTLRQIARRQVDQFLSALFLPEELIELRFIESWLSHGKKRSRVVRAAQWLQRADVIAMHAGLTAFAKRTRANIYFGVCPRPRSGRRRRSAASRPFAASGATSTTSTLTKRWARWTDAGIPQPSIVVSSGSGVHGYWLLEQDLHSPEERSRLGAMLPCFYASFGGDHVQNLSRILRLPGTLNYKDARNGRPPQACTLCACDSDLRYPLEAFSPWFEQAERHLFGSETEHVVRGDGWILSRPGPVPTRRSSGAYRPARHALPRPKPTRLRNRLRPASAGPSQRGNLGACLRQQQVRVGRTAVFRPDHHQRRKDGHSGRNRRIPITSIDLIRSGLVPRPNGCLHAIGLRLVGSLPVLSHEASMRAPTLMPGENPSTYRNP